MTDTEKINDFMRKLEHPLKAEIEAVRAIILKADNKISERVKWNAPSFYYKQDLVTFNPRAKNRVHLVFHNAAIVDVRSDLLEGDYKDRRMMYFYNMEEVGAKSEILGQIMKELVIAMERENGAF